jgi:MtN3 and saliva related transmembrane protein
MSFELKKGVHFMKLVTIIGFIAGTFSSIGFIPQVVKGFMTKKVDDVALWQPVLLSIGMVLWFVYGVMLNDMPIMAANFIAIICNIIVTIQKFVYKGNG